MQTNSKTNQSNRKLYENLNLPGISQGLKWEKCFKSPKQWDTTPLRAAAEEGLGILKM